MAWSHLPTWLIHCRKQFYVEQQKQVVAEKVCTGHGRTTWSGQLIQAFKETTEAYQQPVFGVPPTTPELQGNFSFAVKKKELSRRSARAFQRVTMTLGSAVFAQVSVRASAIHDDRASLTCPDLT